MKPVYGGDFSSHPLPRTSGRADEERWRHKIGWRKQGQSLEHFWMRDRPTKGPKASTGSQWAGQRTGGSWGQCPLDGSSRAASQSIDFINRRNGVLRRRPVNWKRLSSGRAKFPLWIISVGQEEYSFLSEYVLVAPRRFSHSPLHLTYWVDMYIQRLIAWRGQHYSTRWKQPTERNLCHHVNEFLEAIVSVQGACTSTWNCAVTTDIAIWCCDDRANSSWRWRSWQRKSDMACQGEAQGYFIHNTHDNHRSAGMATNKLFRSDTETAHVYSQGLWSVIWSDGPRPS